MSDIGHNQTDRKSLIREIKGDIDAIEADIAVLMLSRKKAKGRIKSDLGWKVADWNAMMRVVDLEEDARDELFNVMREGFQALEVGGQASFLDVIDPKAVAKAERPKKEKRGKGKIEVVSQTGLEVVETELSSAEEIASHILGDDHQPEPEQTDIEDFVESEEPLDAA